MPLMHEDWKRLLDHAGAVFADDGVLHFGNPNRERRAALAGSVICDLSHHGLIRAQGVDAMRFLQGQLTNDAARVDDGHSQLSGYCTPKGRLLAILRLFARDGGYWMRLPASLLEPTLARLRKYVLMSKLTLEPTGDGFTAIGLSGPRSPDELAEAIGGAVPDAVDAVTTRGLLTVIRIPGRHPRFEIHGPVDAMTALWSRLNVHAAPVGAGVWSLLDILAGVPEILPETAEEFIPQTVNLDLLGGISFNKGCYTGQEIVARLHYRGTVKRRMYLAECDADGAIRPGSAVYTGGGDQSAGQVVIAAPGAERGWTLLVSVIVEQAQAGALHLGAADGPPLTLRDLPALRAGEDA